jgi:dienelactone hydrolase
MTTVLLFHHALGQTKGFNAFADELRAAGHTVHAPDLYEGNTFEDLDEGVGFAKKVGFDEIMKRGVAATDGLPDDVVVGGFSLGVMPAQALAQTRPGARGALFYHGCLPPSEFESPWPENLPLQVHIMESDPWADEDLPAARELTAGLADGELFLYPGSGHLFADSSSPDYEEQAAGLLMERTLAFLDRVG